ncbi:hypothetical protein SK168_004158 [Salmonella enterica]|nr:hypothetical protein [Salmonella enterica]ELX8521935.1 hypothetical protein [Salmonella enterica]
MSYKERLIIAADEVALFDRITVAARNQRIFRLTLTANQKRQRLTLSDNGLAFILPGSQSISLGSQ